MARRGDPRYVIDSGPGEGGRRIYRVWQTAPDPADNMILGEYDSLTNAKTSVAAQWFAPDDADHEAWGYAEDDVIPIDGSEEEYPHQ